MNMSGLTILAVIVTKRLSASDERAVTSPFALSSPALLSSASSVASPCTQMKPSAWHCSYMPWLFSIITTDVPLDLHSLAICLPTRP